MKMEYKPTATRIICILRTHLVSHFYASKQPLQILGLPFLCITMSPFSQRLVSPQRLHCMIALFVSLVVGAGWE